MSDTSLIFNVLAKDKASGVFDRLGGKAKLALAAAGVAAIGFATTSVKAFADAETSQLKLQDAFEKFPALADTNIERLRALNTTLAQKTKFDDDATATGQASLAMFKFTGKQIEDLTPLLQDFAAKTGMDMDAAAKVFGRAMLGQGRGLKQVGINFKDTGTEAGNYAQLMDGLKAKVGGFAEKEGKTAAGQTAILGNQFGELQEKVGGMLVPALLKLVPVLQNVLGFLDRNAGTIMRVLAVLGPLVAIIWVIIAAKKAWVAVQTALNIVMMLNPIGLIVLAIIVLVAIIVVLWMKSAAFRNFFIGLWNHIWGFLKGIGAWFAGPFVGFFVGAWNWIKKKALEFHQYIIGRFVAILTFVRELPGKITAAASNMWTGIVNAFKSMVNWLIGYWNRLDLSISIPAIGILGFGGFSTGDLIPDLPYLDRGGLITRTGMAVVHSGEAVVPARATTNGGAGGMQVTFGGDLDSMFATYVMKAFREGKIKISSRSVIA